MCRGRDPGILGLYQSYNSASELCYRLNLTPQIPLSYRSCFPETTEVTSTVQPNQNRFDFFIVSSGNSRFPYSLVQTKIFNQLISSMRMIPYSRPKLSDLYTLSQSKLLENHTLHSSTYLYIPFMAVPPPPPQVDSRAPGKVLICTCVSHFHWCLFDSVLFINVSLFCGKRELTILGN